MVETEMDELPLGKQARCDYRNIREEAV